MILSGKKLKKMFVETQSGQCLGKVIDFEMQTESFIIENFLVATKILIPGLFENKLMINNNQIIDIKDDKIIVEDNVIKTIAKENENVSVENVERAEPVITSEQE